MKELQRMHSGEMSRDGRRQNPEVLRYGFWGLGSEVRGLQ
jgi:hypothetical protein